MALIINNKQFSDPSQFPERHGTDVDEKNLTVLLKKLGYEVKTYRNLASNRIIEVAKDFANLPEQKSMDSSIIAVFTHGRYEELVGSDSVHFSVYRLISSFNAQNAPLLRGKPKIFIIQACRGDFKDSGVCHRTGVDSADVSLFSSAFSCFKPMEPISRKEPYSPSTKIQIQRSPQRELNPFPVATSTTVKIQQALESMYFPNTQRGKGPRIPTEADILIAYATTPKYVSWRNSTNGSWFIQSICEVFSKHSGTMDIMKLLTRVDLFFHLCHKPLNSRSIDESQKFTNPLQESTSRCPNATVDSGRTFTFSRESRSRPPGHLSSDSSFLF